MHHPPMCSRIPLPTALPCLTVGAPQRGTITCTASTAQYSGCQELTWTYNPDANSVAGTTQAHKRSLRVPFAQYAAKRTQINWDIPARFIVTNPRTALHMTCRPSDPGLGPKGKPAQWQ
jgi:hypothetical protein